MVTQRASFYLCLLVILITQATAEPDDQYPVCLSRGGDYAPNSTYHTNLNTVLSRLTSNTQIDYGFYNSSYGQDSDRVYATGLCRGDVSRHTCLTCLNNSSFFLLKNCPHQKEAVGFGGYDKCILHYADQSMFSYQDSSFRFYFWEETNVTNWDQYSYVLNQLLSRLRVKAATSNSNLNRKFAAGNATVPTPSSQTIYAVVQCYPDLTAAECNDCLIGAFSEIPKNCNNRSGCGVTILSCNFRYENSSFYEPTPDTITLQFSPQGSPSPTPSITSNSSESTYHGKSSKSQAVNAKYVVAPILFFVGLLILICIYLRVRKPTKHFERIDYGFYNLSYGENMDKVNAIGLCRGDVKPDECSSCLNNSTVLLTQLCPNQKEAIGWYDKCMLRYSNRSIYGVMETSPLFYLSEITNATDVDQFNQVLGNLMSNLTGIAASGNSLRKYAAANATAPNSQTIYGAAQCTPDLSEQDCNSCLVEAFSRITSCCIGNISEINYGFYNLSYGENEDKVNAIGLCRGDLKPDECRSCLNDARGNLTQRCPNQKEAIIYYDECLLRYSDRSIFGVMETSPDYVLFNIQNATNVGQFNQVLRNLMRMLTGIAASGDSRRKYAAASATATNIQAIYGLVQCTPDLSQPECKHCLIGAISEIPRCCNGKIGGRVLRPSCNIRYENYPFYDEPTAYAPAPSPSLSL
ncbi:hypothetical protein JHK85_029854 [Glycine max]|nr:hypothetical protein JHK85_029854 [Glycine max]